MELTAASRYTRLTNNRTQFLDAARECAKLSIPYLLPPSGHFSGDNLKTPWQSLASKGCSVLASKLMLSLFPINAKFFKLQISDGALAKDPDIDAQARSEIDLVLSKMERVVMQDLADKADRVVLHQAMKHLVVAGNVLIYMGNGKKPLKLYPMDRYVCVRDGEGTVTEIITVEAIDRQFLPEKFQQDGPSAPSPDNHVGNDSGGSVADVRVDPDSNEAIVYTWAKLRNGQWRWHQETDEEIIEGTESSAPKSASPWIPLRWDVADGEDYGRSRILEYLGDLKSLEALSQALVEGSAIASKVIFTLSPSATTKPNQLAQAANGAIISGRPDDVSVITTGGKGNDFKTAFDMIGVLTQRLSDAFLILSIRESERTTAEEVRATQQELNEQLGGIFSTLSSELLAPFIARKLLVLQRQKMLPQLPKGMVFPTVVAGLEGVGRGQDREALIMFMQTISQTLGPETMMANIKPEECIKRLAAATGIDYLGLVKTAEEKQAEQEAAQQQMQQQQMMEQMGQLAGSPLADPQKNPALMEMMSNAQNQEAGPADGGMPPEEAGT